MEHYLILARSVTYAQRMQRAPRDVTDLGCAYVVRLAPDSLASALTILHREGLYPVRVFLFRHDGYQEVQPI